MPDRTATLNTQGWHTGVGRFAGGWSGQSFSVHRQARSACGQCFSAALTHVSGRDAALSTAIAVPASII